MPLALLTLGVIVASAFALHVIAAMRRPSVRSVSDAFRAGEFRRSRSLARLGLRRGRRAKHEVFALLEANALLWEGKHERVLARCDRHRRSAMSSQGRADEPYRSQHVRSEASWLLLELLALVFAGRGAEAEALGVQHRVELDHLRGTQKAEVTMIEALVLFEKARYDEAKSRLDAVVEGTRREVPLRQAAHLCLAVIAHHAGDDARARSELSCVRHVKHGFVAQLARSQWTAWYPEQAPSKVRVAWRERTRCAAEVVLSGFVRLRRDLTLGLNLLSLRVEKVRHRSYTPASLVLLLLANAAIVIGLRCVDHAPGAILVDKQILALLAPILSLIVVALLAACGGEERSARAWRLFGALLSAAPVLMVGFFVASRLHPASFDTTLASTLQTRNRVSLFVEILVGLWLVLVFLRLCHAVGARAPATLGALGVLIGGVLVPIHFWAQSPLFYSSKMIDEVNAAQETLTVARDEQMFEQAELLHIATTSLSESRPNVVDLYFVAAAGWAEQNVFLNEVEAAQRLFDERFDTHGRTLLLSNDRSTKHTLPLASNVTLHRAIDAVSKRMDVEEDVLFLFVTSHGSRGGLAFGYEDDSVFDAQRLEPMALRSMLDGAHIKWRVLVISGCESGVFVGPLSSETTLVATASASDRPSYGCETGNAYTDFGRALFGETLKVEPSFPVAFRQAAQLIEKREAADKIKASRPQISEGVRIGAKLRELERSLLMRR